MKKHKANYLESRLAFKYYNYKPYGKGGFATSTDSIKRVLFNTARYDVLETWEEYAFGAIGFSLSIEIMAFIIIFHALHTSFLIALGMPLMLLTSIYITISILMVIVMSKDLVYRNKFLMEITTVFVRKTLKKYQPYWTGFIISTPFMKHCLLKTLQKTYTMDEISLAFTLAENSTGTIISYLEKAQLILQ